MVQAKCEFNVTSQTGYKAWTDKCFQSRDTELIQQ